MRVRIEEVDPKALEPSPRNARFMRHETFDRLSKNIKRDGALTSVPFCVRSPTPGKVWRIVSGHHRVKGAIDAGLATILVLVTDEPLSEAARRAIQLAHNAVVGEDDPAVLREIYESIDACDLKEYCGLDDKVLELLEKVGTESLAASQLDFASVLFLFLPDEVERLKRGLAAAGKAAGEERFAARFADYDRFMDAMALAGDAHGVSNAATAVGLLLDVFERHIDDLAGGFLDRDGTPNRRGVVPVAAALRTNHMPVATAALLAKLFEREGDPFALLDDAIRTYLSGGKARS